MGEFSGTLLSYENTTLQGIGITVAVTAENDAPMGTGLPASVAGNEDAPFDVDLSALQLNDPDGPAVSLTLTLQASEGRIDLASGAGVTVGQSGGAIANLSGTAAALEAYLEGAGTVRYTGAQDDFGSPAAQLTVSGSDGIE